MKFTLLASILVMLSFIMACSENETHQNRETTDFYVGNPLGLPVTPSTDEPFEPMSSNVKVYGAIFSAESCSYDEERGMIVVPNRGVPQNVRTNDGWISLINSDGSVHTARWIGVQNPPVRENLSPPFVLNEPLGSHITNGILLVGDGLYPTPSHNRKPLFARDHYSYI